MIVKIMIVKEIYMILSSVELKDSLTMNADK